MEFKLRPWNISDLDSLVQYANNWNVAKNMTDKFPFPYSESNGRAFIEFATKDEPIHIFAIDLNGIAVGGIGIHPQDDIHRKNADKHPSNAVLPNLKSHPILRDEKRTKVTLYICIFRTKLTPQSGRSRPL